MYIFIKKIDKIKYIKALILHNILKNSSKNSNYILIFYITSISILVSMKSF